MSVHDSWRQRQSICSCITPLIHLWGDVLYILILAADIRIEYWSYTRYVQFFYPQSWSLYSFTTTNSPSKQFISLHIKIPYLHDESPQQQKCNVLYVCNLHNGFCWWNACWASITTSQTWNNKNTSTSGNPKLFKTKVKIYRLIFFFFFSPLHQLTVNRTHDDSCSALLGYFHTKNDHRHLKHYNTHQN